jgi:hydrogenase nickel insertion protein HypA
MHEVSIVEALIDQVQREVEHAGHAGRVVRLQLIVGRLSGVCCDSLRFAFDLLKPATLVADAVMDIAEPRPVCCCRDCQARAEIDELVAQCPRCRSGSVVIEGGRELLLQSIEIEE